MKVAIIGGGVIGLSTAYFLAREGADVTVFEQKYLLYGASGRNSGGITAMHDNEAMIELAKRSIELYEVLPSEVDFNFLFRQDGYIKVAATGDDFEALKEEVRLQNSLGVKSRIIDAYEVKDFIPDFNEESIIGGAYEPSGGVIFPWPVIWGLAKGCRELGVEIRDNTEVKEILVENGRVEGVVAGDETFRAEYVVNAAGAWSNRISSMAGVELDNKIIKEEICVTESLKPYLNQYLLDITTGVYLSQSMRGEIVGGILGSEADNLSTSSTLDFVFRYSRRAIELIPKLKGLALLRQWAGVYDEGKDGLPVVGETKIDGFIQANGFGKAGMSVGPAVGEELAKLILKGKSEKLAVFNPERF